MKIVTVVGARPQFIKAAVVSRAIENHNLQSSPKENLKEILVHTGQHYDYLMDRVFFEELEIPKPHYHLGVGSGSHGKQTGVMLERIEEVLQKENPGVVLVYGDTNSTLAGALAAGKLNIPVAHVEAGLRSYNLSMPEEVNRLVADHLSAFLFCPTSQAIKNLEKEGIRPGRGRVVKNVGDVMYDSILYYSQLAEGKSNILKKLDLCFPATYHPKLITRNYYLATLHRVENTDDPGRLKSILKALHEIGKDTPVIFPLHPRTKKVMNRYHLLPERDRIKLIDPVSYLNMLMLEKHARAILTDSGGVQKEAYWFKVPCLTLRDETEWKETVECGWNIVAGAKTQMILKGVKSLDRRKISNKRMNLFGDGKAGQKIIQELMRQREGARYLLIKKLN